MHNNNFQVPKQLRKPYTKLVLPKKPKKEGEIRRLYYDIETTPLRAWIWRPGKQVVRPGQLDKEFNEYDIICIGYTWDTGEQGVLHWGFDTQDSKPMVEAFTKLCDMADVVIGKNSARFDDKHMNTLRMRHGLEARPDLMEKVDDLERQIRRYFYLPSYGLDYISEILGFGGKVKMEFDDWLKIVLKDKDSGLEAFIKMIYYCGCDTYDSAVIFETTAKHFKPKHRVKAFKEGEVTCKYCGSLSVHKNGTTTSAAGTIYQNYYCKDHGGHAGKSLITSKKTILK